MSFLNHSKILSKLYKLCICAFLVLMLLFPTPSLNGAKRGLLLWFNTILPTLLPFIIISSLIVKLNIANALSRILHPFIGRIFRVSKNACYPIVLGFLSGIPMGAKTSADMVSEHKITKDEGQFLAIMCNNASPMFVLGYIALTELNLPNLKLPIILILYGSSILTACLFRKFHTFFTHHTYNNILIDTSITPGKVYAQSTDVSDIKKHRGFKIDISMVDTVIMNSFEIITRVGGYIILFSILAQILLSIEPIQEIIRMILVGIFEITIGIDTIATSTLSNGTKIVLILAITSFGGFSSIAQTKSVFADSGLSIRSYIKAKIVNSLITLCFAFIYVKLVLHY